MKYGKEGRDYISLVRQGKLTQKAQDTYEKHVRKIDEEIERAERTAAAIKNANSYSSVAIAEMLISRDENRAMARKAAEEKNKIAGSSSSGRRSKLLPMTVFECRYRYDSFRGLLSVGMSQELRTGP